MNNPSTDHSDSEERTTPHRKLIDSTLLDKLLDGLTETERFVLISRFHDDLSVSQLAGSLEVQKKDIQRFLTSAVRILVCNCMDTMSVKKNDTAHQHSDSQGQPTEGSEQSPRVSIDSTILDDLLEGVTDAERFALISFFYADISVSRLAKMLEEERVRIQQLLSSAATILVHNCMETMVITEGPKPESSVKEGSDSDLS